MHQSIQNIPICLAPLQIFTHCFFHWLCVYVCIKTSSLMVLFLFVSLFQFSPLISRYTHMAYVLYWLIVWYFVLPFISMFEVWSVLSLWECSSPLILSDNCELTDWVHFLCLRFGLFCLSSVFLWETLKIWLCSFNIKPVLCIRI